MNSTASPRIKSAGVLLGVSLFVVLLLVAHYHSAIAVLLFDAGLINTMTIQSGVVSTEYGDSFRVHTECRGAPYSLHNIYEIRVETRAGGRWTVTYATSYSTRSMTLDKAMMDPTYPRIKFVALEDSAQMRFYEFWAGRVLLVKDKRTDTFWAGDWGEIGMRKAASGDPLLRFARNRLDTGDWHWVKMFGELLARNGEPGVKELLHRYARGEFTQHELAVNAHGDTSPTLMKELAQQSLRALAHG